MPGKGSVVLLSVLFLSSTSFAVDSGGTFDACALITRSEIAAVQGEPVVEAKSSASRSAGFTIAQCYYALPSHTKSISLEVTRPDPGQGAPSVARDRWQKLFHGDTRREPESGGPQRVSGVGEEAFWMGDPMVGALYVLKGQSYLRVSIGGSGDQSLKIKKTKALAGKAVRRL